MTDSEFMRFLLERGLAAAASTATMHDLKQRYGVRRWFDFQDVVHLPPASLFAEQTEPFLFVWDRNCLLPPTELECDFDYHRNGPDTHALALKRLTALFGKPEKGTSVNTLEQTWKFERMSLRIRTFLRVDIGSRSPLYEKYPELWNFCRISIQTNWVRPLAPEDAMLLDLVRQRDICPVHRFFRRFDQLSRWERGLFRLAEKAPVAPPFLWKHATSVGWSAGPWSAFFDRGRCIELLLEQAEPGRTGGYSRLLLTLRNPFTLEQKPDNTVLFAAEETFALDKAAAEVSAYWGLPLKITHYDDY